MFLHEHYALNPDMWGQNRPENVQVFSSEISFTSRMIGESGIFMETDFVGSILPIIDWLGEKKFFPALKTFKNKFFTQVANDLWAVKNKYYNSVKSNGVFDLSTNTHPTDMDIVLLNNVWLSKHEGITDASIRLGEINKRIISSLNQKNGGFIISTSNVFNSLNVSNGRIKKIMESGGYYIFEYTPTSDTSLPIKTSNMLSASS